MGTTHEHTFKRKYMNQMICNQEISASVENACFSTKKSQKSQTKLWAILAIMFF